MTTEAKTAPLPTILFNKAAYTNGDDVILNISNATDKITSVTVSHLGTEIQKLDHLNSTSVKLSSDIFSPNSGYVVKVETIDNTGNHTSKTLGLSVEDDWTVFPRYGVVAGSNDNSAERNNSMTNDQLAGYQNNIEQLAQMHINNYSSMMCTTQPPIHFQTSPASSKNGRLGLSTTANPTLPKSIPC